MSEPSPAEQQLTSMGISAEKDSLVDMVLDNVQLLSEITAEVARVQKPAAGSGEEGVLASITRDNLLENVRALTTRIEEGEARLAESERRIAALGEETEAEQKRTADLRRTLNGLRTTLNSQKETIASLTEQLNAARDENVRLVVENTALAEEKTELTQVVDEMTVRENTVYYVVGTKEELLQRGIIEEEGGSRVLFVFGKTGKTLVPARDLDLSAFAVADKRHLTEIPLPGPEAEYRIVTRQDLSSLETPVSEKGTITGALRIADPERFWAGQKYLIVVRAT